MTQATVWLSIIEIAFAPGASVCSGAASGWDPGGAAGGDAAHSTEAQKSMLHAVVETRILAVVIMKYPVLPGGGHGMKAGQ
jgi:hypothetical protein